MENWNDLPDKMKELVVEEKTNEKNWNDLPFEMKAMVVKEMTFETRVQLKRCSKNDKYLVESVPFSYHHMSIKINKNLYDRFILVVEISQNPNMAPFKLEMDVDSNIVTITRFDCSQQQEKVIPCSSVEERQTVVKQVIASVLSTGKLRFKKVSVVDPWGPYFSINSEFTIHAKDVHILVDTNEITGWLNVIAPGVESVCFASFFGASRDVLKDVGPIPTIINASKLKVEFDNNINDEELLNFKCTSLKLKNSNVTGKGINQLIKKLIANDYPIGTHFELIVSVNSQTWDKIIEGLDVETIESYDVESVSDLDSDEEEVHQEVRHLRKTGQIKMSHGKQMEVSVCRNTFCMSIEAL